LYPATNEKKDKSQHESTTLLLTTAARDYAKPKVAVQSNQDDYLPDAIKSVFLTVATDVIQDSLGVPA
jgi:hypothetical protein